MVSNSEMSADCALHSERKTAAAKVFEAAMDLFYRRGIRAVGVDEIVCEAGVTKPSLYRAFKSKDELVAACLQETGREGREAILAAIEAAGDDPRERMRAMIQHFAGKLSCPDFRGCLASNVAVELPEPEHPGRVVLKECKAQMLGLLESLALDLAAPEPDVLAAGLMLVIEGAISTHHIFGNSGPWQALTATCDRLIDCQLRSRDHVC